MFSSNSVGLGSPTKALTVMTSEEAPSGPPSQVRVEPVSSSELRVTWQVSNDAEILNIAFYLV